MRKTTAVIFSAAMQTLIAAPVSVSGVSWEQDGASHVVKVAYTLAEDAIVTVEVVTNGVPLKGITHLVGDVCRLVEKGDRSFLWAVECSHPGIASLPEESEVRVLAWKRTDPPDYLVASLAVTNDLAYYPDEASLPFGIGSSHYRRDALVMRRIRAKGVTWRMGASEKEIGANKWSSERAHLVTLTNDYYIGVFELTQGQYMSLKRWPGGRFTTGDTDMVAGRPRDSLSYNDIRGSSDGANWPDADYAVAHAVDSGSMLDSFRKMTGIGNLDLPTEAQWEYACRAGTNTGLSDGSDITSSSGFCRMMHRLGRYIANGGKCDAPSVHSSTGGTARVGSYLPNAWGLYDMHGNVREWCLDRLGEYAAEPVTEPVGPSGEAPRCTRGGGFSDGPYICRSANRSSAAPDSRWAVIGCRLSADILPDENRQEEVDE